MIHVGMDVHKRFSEVAALDDAGLVVDRRKLFHDDPAALAEYFRRLFPEAKVTLEATRNWYWILEAIEAEGLPVKLAHPRRVRLIAESAMKSDKIDAVVLAQLERTNFLPEAWIPPRDIRDRRELLRYRIALVYGRTSYKNRIHALIDKLGIVHGFSELFGGEGREFLKQLELRSVYRDAMDTYLRVIDKLDEEILTATKKIKAVLKPDPRAQLLTTIPGIGDLSAYLLLYEIGDIHRFRSARKLSAYAGIVPRLSQSAEHCYHGHITKEGNRYIRWTVVEAAQKAPSKDPTLLTLYSRIARQRGPQKARVAIGHRILEAVFYVLTYEEPYRPYRPNRTNLSKPGRDAGQTE
jgi:transposase